MRFLTLGSDMRIAAAPFAVAALLVGAFIVSNDLRQTTASAAVKCTMARAQPSSGTLTLKYLRASTRNDDRNDYRLSGTVKWNHQADIDCFSEGKIDWAYEHDIFYQKKFHRKIWGVDLSSFPTDTHPYIDTTTGDKGDRTSLSFGLFKPDKLKAGVVYRFGYSIFLPNDPKGGSHSLYVRGEVLQRNCSRAGPWCVGLHGPRDDEAFIGTKWSWAVKGTTCYSWKNGRMVNPRGHAPRVQIRLPRQGREARRILRAILPRRLDRLQ